MILGTIPTRLISIVASRESARYALFLEGHDSSTLCQLSAATGAQAVETFRLLRFKRSRRMVSWRCMYLFRPEACNPNSHFVAFIFTEV